ncbi:MAG TPA: ferritin-like domain-containing protein [Thermomicrobiales bacterium]|nr:ferritin-like domain-containing protein [Thermomicrobiales bacterium]
MQMHDQLLNAVSRNAARPATRRGILTGSLKLAAGGTMALAFAGSPAFRALEAAAAQAAFGSDIDVLNYALTLEHLESTFYRQGLEDFTVEDFTDAGYDEQVYEYFTLIGDHEAAHVNVLASTIEQLGGEPVQEAEYDFGYQDVDGFVGVAQALENTGVAAYTGAASALTDSGLLTAALTIHGVEARHAAYLNQILGEVPFPEAFETPLSPDEVLGIAGPFIVSGSVGGDDTQDAAGEDAAGDDTATGGTGAAAGGTTSAMPTTGSGPQIPAMFRKSF